MILVHIDNYTIGSNSIECIVHFKNSIQEHIEITDMGKLYWFLGLEITRNHELCTISILQHSYIDFILCRHNFDHLKPVSIPMDPSLKLSSAQCPSTTAEIARMHNIPYYECVGELIYVMISTCPDISYAVQTVSCFMHNPGLEYWQAVERIFCGIKNLWLIYGCNIINPELYAYGDTDSNVAEDQHALSGYAVLLNGGAVSWSTKKQEIVSLSTTESEYIAATHTMKEVLWLQSLIHDIFGMTLDPTILYSDNKSAIELTKEHCYHARTKHIDIKYHFIRWIVEESQIKLVYHPTDEMIADTLTKALPSPKVKHFTAIVQPCVEKLTDIQSDCWSCMRQMEKLRCTSGANSRTSFYAETVYSCYHSASSYVIEG